MLIFATDIEAAGVDRFYPTISTITLWILHAASGLCFVLFKFIIGHHLEAEAG